MTHDIISHRAESLQRALGLTIYNSGIGYNNVTNEWYVMIFDKVKKPPMTVWYGRKINYSIGGGNPVALVAV